MVIREVMTEHAEWIGPDAALTDVAQRMQSHNIGCLPVGENDRLIGIVTDRDLACRAIAKGMNPKSTKARSVMTKGITWCYDDETLETAAQRMEEKQIHHMPVLNRDKRIVGILTVSDLALRAPKEFSSRVSRLASRDAQRHASTQAAH